MNAYNEVGAHRAYAQSWGHCSEIFPVKSAKNVCGNRHEESQMCPIGQYSSNPVTVTKNPLAKHLEVGIEKVHSFPRSWYPLAALPPCRILSERGNRFSHLAFSAKRKTSRQILMNKRLPN